MFAIPREIIVFLCMAHGINDLERVAKSFKLKKQEDDCEKVEIKKKLFLKERISGALNAPNEARKLEAIAPAQTSNEQRCPK